MANRKGSSWKMERAGVNRQGKPRSRSNKFSGGDTTERPSPGTRQRVWVGGYKRSDGTNVEGYYRSQGRG